MGTKSVKMGYIIVYDHKKELRQTSNRAVATIIALKCVCADGSRQ